VSVAVPELSARRRLARCIILFSLACAGVAAQQALNLPPGPISATPSLTPTASAYLSVTLSGLPSGYILSNGAYSGWCVDFFGQLGGSNFTPYDTYGAVNGDTDPALPALANLNGQAAWNEVNWVINNVGGNSQNDVQNVIWDLLDPYYAGYFPILSQSDAAKALYAAAIQQPNFVPGPGQVVAVLLYIDGIQNAENGNVQDLLIEVPVPTPLPNIQIKKTADNSTPDLFQPVTYSYLITNIGGTPLNNIVVVDDNGTPNYPGDDVTLTYNDILPVGQSITLTSTRIPYVNVSYTGGTIDDNTLIVMTPTAGPYAGDVIATYRQSLSANDNSYGTNSSKLWGLNGHKFTDLLNDNAEFQFTNKNGNVVLDFVMDYLSKAAKSPWGQLYPSGYGSLGVTGGDGKMIYGSSKSVLFATTTLADDLNQSAAYYGYTTNSPASSDPGAANWDFVDGYTVVVAGSIFGPNGAADFGGVNVPWVLNSSGKNCYKTKQKGQIMCNTTVSNKAEVDATATAQINGKTVYVSDYSIATVTVVNNQNPQCSTPGGCTTRVVNCSYIKEPKMCSGYYLWFSSSFTVNGLPWHDSKPVTLTMTNASITLTSGNQTYNIPVPNGTLTLMPGATSPSTMFNASNNAWQTQAQAKNGIEAFISGVAFSAPINLSSADKVSWSATITSDTPGVTVQWEVLTQAFSKFTTNYNSLGVLAVEGSDEAGTPEHFECYEIDWGKSACRKNNSNTICVSICPQKKW